MALLIGRGLALRNRERDLAGRAGSVFPRKVLAGKPKIGLMPSMEQMPRQAPRGTDKKPEIVTQWVADSRCGFGAIAILLEAD